MKPMKYRDVEAALLAQGCKWRNAKGDHEKWFCPASCGQHAAVVTTAHTVSVGVIRDIIEKLSCLPKGWLQ